MKQIQYFFALAALFCATNFQTAEAAAAADPDKDTLYKDTLYKVTQRFSSFQERVLTAFSAINPGAAVTDVESFEFNWGMLGAEQRYILVTTARDLIPRLEEDAASVDLIHKLDLAAAATAGAGTRFDPTHAIFPRIMDISEAERARAEKFVSSLEGCNDWDVHKFNRDRVVSVGVDKLLFNTIMPALGIGAGTHSENIERVRTLAARIYEGEAGKIASVNAVLGSLKSDTTPSGDGLQEYPVHAAMAQVLTLAELANEALDQTDAWLRLFLDKIAENKETGGGCLPGIMGRLVEVGMRTFNSLATVAPTAVGINASRPAAGGYGEGGAEEGGVAAGGGASASSNPLAGATGEERAIIESIAGDLGIDASSKTGVLDAYRAFVADGLSEDKIQERLTVFLLES